MCGKCKKSVCYDSKNYTLRSNKKHLELKIQFSNLNFFLYSKISINVVLQI